MISDKKNSSWLAIQFIATFTIGLIGYYLNLHLFKEKLFGAWLTLASLWGMGAALDFGFGLTIVKYVAQYNNEQKSKINELISSVFFIFTVLGILVFIILNVIAYFFYFTNPDVVPDGFRQSLQSVFVLLGVAFLFQYFTLFMKSVLEGLNSFVAISKINLLNTILIFIGVAVGSIYRLSIIYLSIVYLASSIIVFTIFVFVIKRKYSFISVKIKYYNFAVIRDIYKYSMSVQLTSFFTALIDPVIKYVISNNYKIDYVPIYELARRATSAISGLFFTAFKIILPKASILRTKLDYSAFIMNEGAKYTRMGLVYSGFAFGILSLPILFVLRSIFKYDDIIILFLILGLGETINNVGYTIYIMILGIGKAYFVVLVQFINVVIITASMVVGFALFHNPYGLLGYFITVTIVNVMTFVFIKKQSGIFLTQFLIKINIVKLIYLLIMIGLALFVISNNYFNYFIVLFVLSVFSSVLFGNDIITYTKDILTIENSYKMIKKLIIMIKWFFNLFGIEVSRKRSLEDKIEMGQFNWLRNLKICTIIDVGANDGFFVSNYCKIYPDAKIYSFEPLSEPFKVLKDRTKHLKNINCYNYALGDSEGEAVINHNEFSPSSSLLEITSAHTDAFPFTKSTFQEKIQIKKLDNVVRDLEIIPNVLLKIDVQGYEMSVLNGAGTFLASVDAVLIETSYVELYQGQAMFDDIYEFMKRNKFIYKGNIEQLQNPYTGEMLQADSLFIKNRILPKVND